MLVIAQGKVVNVFAWNGTSYTRQSSNFGEDGRILFSPSSDGTFVVLGYRDYKVGMGLACVYAWTGSTCIGGQVSFGYLGWLVELSDDGTVLAVAQRGGVHVYSWNGVNYVQQGVNFFMGRMKMMILTMLSEVIIKAGISFSGNGDVLALGVYGTVYVYSWINGTYAKRGADINRTATNNKFGSSVDLSIDGNILAVGSPGKGGDNTGCGRVYSWDGTNYIPRSNDILDGESPGDNYGRSISLSSDGEILAVGAWGNRAGRVFVYKWNGTT